MKNKKTIGIIGGMGPFASSRMLEVVLKASRDKYGAKKDEDFPEILLYSIPVKNFFLDTKNTKSVLKEINSKIRIFEKGKVDVYGIACNTAHLIANKIKISERVEFVSIVEQTVTEVERLGVRKVGLMASPVTIQTKLYQKALENKRIMVVLPDRKQKNQLGEVIDELVSLRNKKKNRKILLEISESLLEKGAEAIILGCAELPLVFPKRNDFIVINTIEVLANRLVEKCYISN